jgi:hypothetical protein
MWFPTDCSVSSQIASDFERNFDKRQMCIKDLLSGRTPESADLDADEVESAGDRNRKPISKPATADSESDRATVNTATTTENTRKNTKKRKTGSTRSREKKAQEIQIQLNRKGLELFRAGRGGDREGEEDEEEGKQDVM